MFLVFSLKTHFLYLCTTYFLDTITNISESLWSQKNEHFWKVWWFHFLQNHFKVFALCNWDSFIVWHFAGLKNYPPDSTLALSLHNFVLENTTFPRTKVVVYKDPVYPVFQDFLESKQDRWLLETTIVWIEMKEKTSFKKCAGLMEHQMFSYALNFCCVTF